MNHKNKNVTAFQKMIWEYYKVSGRHNLPWRLDTSLYSVLISEIMLQQTQVDRVLPKYKLWMKQLPNFKALSQASLLEVLELWQGLGYSRRVKNLFCNAKKFEALLQKPDQITEVDLQTLPGIGEYTAAAIMAFAYDKPVICLETNIRTVFTSYFMADYEVVTDADIKKLIIDTLPQGNYRQWYWALMDYGAFLKKSGFQINSKLKGYTKQKPFKGSLRQLRGIILKKIIAERVISEQALLEVTSDPRTAQVILDLQQEQFIVKHGRMYSVA